MDVRPADANNVLHISISYSSTSELASTTKLKMLLLPLLDFRRENESNLCHVANGLEEDRAYVRVLLSVTDFGGLEPLRLFQHL